jgi:hypothetical protein
MFANAVAMRAEKDILGVDVTHGSTNISSRETYNTNQPELLNTLGFYPHTKTSAPSPAP